MYYYGLLVVAHLPRRPKGLVLALHLDHCFDCFVFTWRFRGENGEINHSHYCTIPDHLMHTVIKAIHAIANRGAIFAKVKSPSQKTPSAP